MTAALAPVILGHNGFFGIDHLSRAHEGERSQRFEDVDRILAVVRRCHELGVRAMMMSTHPRAAVVNRAIQADAGLAREWSLYPLVPYLQKYVRGANEKGLVAMVLETVGEAKLSTTLGLFASGGRALLSRDLRQALRTALDVELAPFESARLGVVFLHDGLTDLAIGLGAESLLEVFRDHVERRYGVRAGFATKNLSHLCERMRELGWRDAVVMSAFNALGFQMNPSLDVCIAALATPGLSLVAMSTLAAGVLPPDAAYRFLGRLPSIESVVVGVSRIDHAEETIDAIRTYMPCARTAAPHARSGRAANR